jgi:hypothetical protein
MTALQAATAENRSDMIIIQLLLKNEADVNASSAKCSTRENREMSALEYVARHEHFELAHYFLKIDADFNASFSEHNVKTALEVAAFYDRLDMLLKAEANMHLSRKKRDLDAAQ